MFQRFQKAGCQALVYKSVLSCCCCGLLQPIGRVADGYLSCCHLTFNTVGQDCRSLNSRGVSMTDFTLNQAIDGASGGPIQPASRPNLDKGFNPLTMIIFFGILAAGLLFVAYSTYADVNATGTKVTTYLPYLLLLVALLIALGFEFVNGFHDTANAVATVIYTHSLPAEFAVMWSGSSISSACCSRAVRSPSASSRCCRWN